ncbi:MAG: hypothetical protein H7A52_10405 [Akkermansiaceae bacterium]|nr:hypothetical protein [Akkermansiaceae bacterium]
MKTASLPRVVRASAAALFAVLSLGFSTASLRAEDRLAIAKKGDLLLEDSLQEVGKTWRAAKGEWKAGGDGVQGSELAADNHGAVMRHPLKFKDAVIAFSFKLDGAKGISLSVNDAKEHVCRVTINKAGFRAQRDDHDHEGPDKAVPFEAVKAKLDDGDWHTAVVEIVGESMVCTIDGKVSEGADALIATEKANLGFTVGGQSASFKDLKVWAATAKE